jgi:hypothetical protein
MFKGKKGLPNAEWKLENGNEISGTIVKSVEQVVLQCDDLVQLLENPRKPFFYTVKKTVNGLHPTKIAFSEQKARCTFF